MKKFDIIDAVWSFMISKMDKLFILITLILAILKFMNVVDITPLQMFLPILIYCVICGPIGLIIAIIKLRTYSEC